ncbi:MAG: 6-phosphofructokinase [Myxococcales bacterium]|jgi:6-phosphofructokinase|nr:6-phosphofructokinase [Myxococcales bacterium]MBL9112542.1 6-phosphofructokinase [Myxococcales bacterium]
MSIKAPPGKLAIVVGGGPAPGINSVIGAATIRACLSGVPVLGVLDGYKHLMKGDTSKVIPLGIQNVSRIHFRGGSHLGISRANPTRVPNGVENAVKALRDLGVTMVVSIGGDGTCFLATELARVSSGELRVVHVPKTIDNDIDLPREEFTFGFQTARHVGVSIVENLMVDAKTTGRWYFAVAMGHKAGHLALGIGKAAGATLTLIGEEFAEKGKKVKLDRVADTLVGAMVKRLASGKPHGIAVLAEGLVDVLDEKDLEESGGIFRDEQGHAAISDIDIGTLVRDRVRTKLKEMGIPLTVVTKNLGYELRCADPIPFDMEYARDLGHSAARFVIEGGSGAVVTMHADKFRAIPFSDMLTPEGRTRVRMVDLGSDRYRIAWGYMVRLKREDFEDEDVLRELAMTAKMSPEAFRERFYPVTEREPRILPLYTTLNATS